MKVHIVYYNSDIPNIWFRKSAKVSTEVNMHYKHVIFGAFSTYQKAFDAKIAALRNNPHLDYDDIAIESAELDELLEGV